MQRLGRKVPMNLMHYLLPLEANLRTQFFRHSGGSGVSSGSGAAAGAGAKRGLELRRKSRKMFPARCYARPTVAAGATKVATAIAIFSVTYK